MAEPASGAVPESDQTVQYRPPAQDSPPSEPAVAPPSDFGAPAAAAAPDYGQPPSYAPPAGSPPPAGGAPGGYASYAPASATPGQPADWGTRFVAWLIDAGIGIGIYIVGFILTLIGGAIADALGVLFGLATFAAVIAYFVWNIVLRQGNTGQSIGKEKQGIKLVKDETGQPVGPGMAFVRYLIAQVISTFTCGIYGLLDYLWPLWDVEKKRLTDKIVKMSVIKV
jgi:uncharacterized RDD family membrane protein YckC